MTEKYEYIVEQDEITLCSSCGSEAPLAQFGSKRNNLGMETGPRMLCEFCAVTMTGSYTDYPPRDMENYLRNEIWKAAANVYNMLKHTDKPEV